ncbi:MAG: glucosaminidase domain-containing protein [Bacteroidia bacterium]
MRKFKTILALAVLLFASSVHAQPSEKKLTPQDYILRYKEDAVKEMLQHGVPASITLAQGMLESGNGNSPLAVYANNHFGIKCHTDWIGPTYTMDDDAKDECFRKYESVLNSYEDHSLFLKSRTRYSFLFDLPKNDYKGWASGLKDAGYATHPKYAEQLIELIEKHNLSQYDKIENMSPIVSKGYSISKPKLEIRESLKFNHTRFVIAKPGDSFFKLASEFDLELEDLLGYNDLGKTDKLQAGQKIYVQRKRRKALEPYHVVTKNETMKSISQLHGIRLYHLYKKNRMKPGDEPKAGDVLYLRSRKPRNA